MKKKPAKKTEPKQDLSRQYVGYAKSRATSARNKYRTQKAFLAAFIANGGLIMQAARTVKIEYRDHTYWMKTDEEYRHMFAEARSAANENLEAEAISRATKGVMRQKFYKGKPIKVLDSNGKKVDYVEYEKSDMLLIRLLEANNPSKFGKGESLKEKEINDAIDAELERLGLGNQA